MSQKQCFASCCCCRRRRHNDDKQSMSQQYYLYNNNLIYTRKSLTTTSIKPSKLKHRSFEEHYVYNVFNRINVNNKSKDNILMRLFKFNTNNNNNNNNIFRYSTRVISTYTICFTVLFYMTCLIAFYGSIFVDMLYLPSIYAHTLIVGALVTSLVCALQLVMSLLALKRHLTSMYKGIQQVEKNKYNLTTFN